MDVTFLGTCSGAPTRDRNVSAAAVRLDDGEIWLVDCGEGTQHRFMHSALKITRLRRVLITHLHGDHCYGLPGLLCSLGMHGHEAPVEIVGPVGVRAYLEGVFAASRAGLPYSLEFTEVERETDLGVRGDIGLSAHPIAHRAPCLGYALRQAPRRGRFDVVRASALGVASGPLFGRLSRGEDVTLPGGKVVHSADVLGPSRPGAHVVLLGDTSDASAIADAAMDCDLLVHEATFDATRASNACEWGHSTAAMAGRLAARVRAKQLALTHFSARYTVSDAAITVEDLVREAAAECPQTRVLAARDFLTVPVTAESPR